MATYYNPQASGVQLSVSTDGGTTFYRVQNITSLDISGGDRTETTAETLDNDPVVGVGSAQPKDVSVGVNYSAGRGYRAVAKAYRDSTRLVAKIATSKKRVIENTTNTRTIAIATTGVVTGVGTKFMSGAWQPGKAIVVGGNNYIIETITSDLSLTVSRPDGMDIVLVSATDDWELWDYGLELEFEVEVLNAGNASFATGGSPVTDTLTLKSTSVLGEWDLAVS